MLKVKETRAFLLGFILSMLVKKLSILQNHRDIVTYIENGGFKNI